MHSVLKHAKFIKTGVAFQKDYTGKNSAPLFRKKFQIQNRENATLYICGLGYAYCYINGQAVSADLFCAPVSQYQKTLWYNRYDVSSLLVEGENTIAVICGNGFYNEDIKSVWNYHEAPWRDEPKLILSIVANGQVLLVSDDSFKCCPESFVTFNALRAGEHFDGRLYDPMWKCTGFDDREWAYAVIDNCPPAGRFRECRCQPIREFEVYPVKEIFQLDQYKYIFDIGQNISGYIRLTSKAPRGKCLTIRYAEHLDENGQINLESWYHFYHEGEYQTDRFISPGQEFVWSPKFTYHGFRYIEIEGIENPDDFVIEGVFVHQAVDLKTTFVCSDMTLNKLFRAGQFSCLSNMFYMLTDCPTREKLGWSNDAHMSCEQLYTNFDIEALFRKWIVDIYDAMREDGSLPGIVPSSGWGYDWGNGPLSDGVLFEIPYRTYLHTGKSDLLVDSLPYFRRYLDYLRTKENSNGWVEFGLGDWATAGNQHDIPVAFVNAVLIRKFYQIAATGAQCGGDTGLEQEYSRMAATWEDKLFQAYIAQDGRCIIDQMSAVAILIYHGVYRELEPLKRQLMRLLEMRKFNHNCGMFGMRCIYEALNICECEEYAYNILMSRGYPSYRDWLCAGATTLFEHWQVYLPKNAHNSRNHHMYSDFMSWIIKTVVGITHNKVSGDAEYALRPFYFEHLDWAKGTYMTDHGKISVKWEKKNGKVFLTVNIPQHIEIRYQDRLLGCGQHEFLIRQ